MWTIPVFTINMILEKYTPERAHTNKIHPHMHKHLSIYVESPTQIHIQKKMKNKCFIGGHYDLTINCIKTTCCLE